MIINGGARRNARFFAQHLAKAEGNERVTLCEVRNLAALTIADALCEMEAIALGSQCVNFFYHANINPGEGEELTPDQWRIAIDRLEEALGLTGHARFVVEHRKKGRSHRHVIWSRINVFIMRAVKMTDDYEKHQSVARGLERQFHLRSVPSVLGPSRGSAPRPHRRPKSWEMFRGQQSGIDPDSVAQEITACYRNSKTAAAFAARLAASGYGLAQGTRQLCIRDRAGHLHSLPRRLFGIDAAALSALIRDLSALLP
jgi:hypothetical protein